MILPRSARVSRVIVRGDQKRPTLAKVAALAGSVSQASDALRDGGRVSAVTRQRVRDAAKQPGYQTQAVAKVLRRG